MYTCRASSKVSDFEHRSTIAIVSEPPKACTTLVVKPDLMNSETSSEGVRIAADTHLSGQYLEDC
jgi:hypothetical protein